MSDSRHSKSYLPQKLSKLSHFWPNNTSFDGITNPCWWVGTHFLWVTMRCCFGAWLMNSEIDPLGWEKIQLKSTQEGNGNPGYNNTGDVAIMISEYPWEIKCPQNRSSAWFLSNSIFLLVTQHLSPVAIKDELIWPAKTLQHFVVAGAASRSH